MRQQLIDSSRSSPETVTSSEVDSGFLEQLLAAQSDDWFGMGEPAAEEVDGADLGEQERSMKYSQLVRRELELVIKLRRLAEGKSAEVVEEDKAANSAGEKTEARVSQETLEMQRLRRERNRRAAVNCRRNRRLRERKLTERMQQLKSEIESLTARARMFEQLYRDSLRAMPTQADFQNYLKRNPQLVRDPLVKPVLRAFVTEDYPKIPQYVMMALVPASSVQIRG